MLFCTFTGFFPCVGKNEMIRTSVHAFSDGKRIESLDEMNGFGDI